MGNQQIKKGAIISYVAIFTNIVAGLLYTPWMIRQIGRADYGLYVLMTSVLTYFIVDYGLSQAITRNLARYKSVSDNRGISNLLGITAKLYLILDIIVIGAIIIFYFFIDKVFLELTAEEIVKFKQIYGIAAFFSILSFPILYISGIYYAFELFFQVKIFDMVSKLSSILLTVFVLSFGYGLILLVMVYAASPFIINVLKLVYLKRKGYLKINWKFWDTKLLKGILNTSIWLLIILLGELFMKNITPTLLGTFSGTDEIAIYAIANTLDSYLLVFAAALNGLFLPKITSFLNKPNTELLIGKLMIKVGRFQIMLVGFLSLAMVLIGKDFILLWVGEHFSKSYYVLLFLILPTFIFSTLQLGTTYILAINKLRYQAYIYVFAAVLNIVLAIIFTPMYGALGSGVSILISKILFYILGFSIVFHKVLKIDMFMFYKDTFYKLIAPFILIAVSYVTFDYFTFEKVTLLSFVINGMVLVLISVIFMYLFYLNDDEKFMLKSLSNRIFKKK